MISRDEQVALANHIMRNLVAPALPETHGAVLLIFPFGTSGMGTYIANARREDMHRELGNLLAKWDADAREKAGAEPLSIEDRARIALLALDQIYLATATFGGDAFPENARDAAFAIADRALARLKT